MYFQSIVYNLPSHWIIHNKLDVVAHACNHSTWEAVEVGLLHIWGQPDLLDEANLDYWMRPCLKNNPPPSQIWSKSGLVLLLTWHTWEDETSAEGFLNWWSCLWSFSWWLIDWNKLVHCGLCLLWADEPGLYKHVRWICGWKWLSKVFFCGFCLKLLPWVSALASFNDRLWPVS